MTPDLVEFSLAGYEKAWWAALREHRLTIQQCDRCGHRQHYPRMSCAVCGSTDCTFTDTAGLGTVASHTTVRRAPFPTLTSLVPYSLALVDLDDGVRLLAGLRDCEPEAVYIGMRVAVDFLDVTNDVTLPVFRPVSR
jgi:uncharacterized OB-fold protein